MRIKCRRNPFLQRQNPERAHPDVRLIEMTVLTQLIKLIAILAAAAYKQSGRCRRLIVTGCLPERYREASSEALPEVDLFLGTGAYDQILAAVEEAAPDLLLELPLPEDLAFQRIWGRNRVRQSTQHAVEGVIQDTRAFIARVQQGQFAGNAVLTAEISDRRPSPLGRKVEDLVEKLSRLVPTRSFSLVHQQYPVCSFTT